MRLTGALLACAACLSLAACGSGADSRSEIRAAFARYESAVASGNPVVACQYMSASLQRQLTVASAASPSESCPLTFAERLLAEDRASRARQRKLAATLKVGALSIRRGRAEVEMSDRLGSLTETGNAAAVLEDGRWRIAQLPRSEIVGRYLVYRVPSAAMSPTLRADQAVLVDPKAYLHRGPEVGDIIAFHPPATSGVGCATSGEGISISGNSASRACGVAGASSSATMFIKRIVAGPGDTVAVHQGRIIRNGTAELGPSAVSCPTNLGCNFPRAVRIPPGTWFVVGDNRAQSADSREWGPIRAAWIVGKLVRVIVG